MRNLWKKLKIELAMFGLRLKLIYYKLIQPFQLANAWIKRQRELRRIDEESKDVWERHAAHLRLRDNDELKQRRTEFFTLKTKIIGAFSRTSISAVSCEESQGRTEAQEEFKRDKKELLSLLKQICNYPEIAFDEEMKSRIISWEYGTVEQEKMPEWSRKILEYIVSLDILKDEK